jgi:hypothetical protein
MLLPAAKSAGARPSIERAYLGCFGTEVNLNLNESSCAVE